MISRAIVQELIDTAKDAKIVCVTGPRQSGKTTLCKQTFSHMPYVSLENPDVALDVLKNPRTFLETYKNGAIIDEAQRVPELFNYLQEYVDQKDANGQFILSGSNHFLMQDKISQSLAGRVAYIELLPLSIQEINTHDPKLLNLHQRLLEGFYPSIVSGKASAKRWLPNYIKTYVERDVRFIRNIGNGILFQKFLKVCASRASQLLNVQNIAQEVGVDHKTIQAWLSVLESSYIIHFLQPHHINFKKRVIKSPKLYFYDTGVLCQLLNIHTIEGLKKSTYFGALFENMIVTELKKNRFNHLQYGGLSFFRDSTGNEVDVVLEKEGSIIPIELKSSTKFHTSDIKNIQWFQKTFRMQGGLVLNAGSDHKYLTQDISLLGWKDVGDL